MAKQIVILGVSQNGQQLSVNCLFWLPITSGALAKTSGSVWGGASQAENNAIMAGTLQEEVQGFTFPMGTLVGTIKDVLNKAWTARNTALAGIGPNLYNGVYFDSVTNWSA